MRVSNGDGSFQIAAGEITLKLRLGPRFAQYFTFVVIDLAQYDFIIGFPDIRAYKLELRCDPVRVVAKTRGGAVELPLTFEEWSSPAPSQQEGWSMSLLSTHDFIRQVRDDDPVYRVVPDGSGHVLASLQAHEVEAEDLEWEAALHALKADAGADAAVLDAAEAARRKAAELDDDQRRLRDRFPETFADELPNRPAAIWPDGQDEHARLRF